MQPTCNNNLQSPSDKISEIFIPLSKETVIGGFKKSVSCLDIDASGSRMIAGCRDNTIKLYDFNGMSSEMQSFRTLVPFEGHPVLAVSWSPTGDAFLAVTGSAQVKIYDRNGVERGESLRGDMYIRDMKNTKGHVSPATCGCWSPVERDTALTSGEDGTLRLWDTNTITQKLVIKPRLKRPARVPVTTCTYNMDGNLLVGGLGDGSIHLWDTRQSRSCSAAVGAVQPPKEQMLGKQKWRYLSGPAGKICYNAHVNDLEISGLAINFDNVTMASRGGDDTLKRLLDYMLNHAFTVFGRSKHNTLILIMQIWDLRKFLSPLHTQSELLNLNRANTIFSPNGKLVVTGSSVKNNETNAAMVFMSLDTFEIVRTIDLPSSVAAIKWHGDLDQIFVGLGNRDNGAIYGYCDLDQSKKGLLYCVNKRVDRSHLYNFEVQPIVHNPHALPLFREERKNKRHNDGRSRKDALKFKPDPGSTAVKGSSGSGGQIGATGGTLLTQYVLKNQGLLNNPADEDIRASLLRHTDPGDKVLNTFTKVYSKTQPERIYAKDVEKN